MEFLGVARFLPQGAGSAVLRLFLAGARPDFFFQAGRLAGPAAQKVEARTTNLRLAEDLNLVDAGRMQQERSFDADAVRGDAPNGEAAVRAAPHHAEDDAFKRLQALAVALDDFHTDPDGLTGFQVGYVRIRGVLFNVSDREQCTLLADTAAGPVRSARDAKRPRPAGGHIRLSITNRLITPEC